MLALMLPAWTGGWHAHDHQPCRMFCITRGTTRGETPRPFSSRLREPAATACLRGVRGSAGSRRHAEAVSVAQTVP